MLCKKCRREITKKEAIYKKWARFWRLKWFSLKDSWEAYSGYFCKKCAKRAEKNRKFLLTFTLFYMILLLFFNVILLIYLIIKNQNS